MINHTRSHHHMYDLCTKHIHHYVLVEMVDGNKIDGIVTHVDNDYVYLAIPNTGRENEERFGYGFGYPGYGYGPGYGYPGYGYGPGRFNRLVLPLAALTALSVLPWF
ncbi:hypothetical protein [Radiobacillus sp. PE A8.2]|uniref:hypothetical protein n=1 Tax=Radiobacillus sp. PE A8.2 TaxID=3380349 RepID=UPI003890383D